MFWENIVSKKNRPVELSHMGNNNNGNPDLVCENKLTYNRDHLEINTW